jgi:hypothetical protein
VAAAPRKLPSACDSREATSPERRKRRSAPEEAQERFDVPSWSRGSAVHANNVHVIVLDPWFGGRESMRLGSTDRGPHAAAADGHTALHAARSNGLRERDDEIRVVIGGIQVVSSKIDHIMSPLREGAR